MKILRSSISPLLFLAYQFASIALIIQRDLLYNLPVVNVFLIVILFDMKNMEQAVDNRCKKDCGHA